MKRVFAIFLFHRMITHNNGHMQDYLDHYGSYCWRSSFAPKDKNPGDIYTTQGFILGSPRATVTAHQPEIVGMRV